MYGKQAFWEFVFHLQSVTRLITAKDAVQRGRACFVRSTEAHKTDDIEWLYRYHMMNLLSESVPRALEELAEEIEQSGEYKNLIASYKPLMAAFRKNCFKPCRQPVNKIYPPHDSLWGLPEARLKNRDLRQTLYNFFARYNWLFLNGRLKEAFVGGFLDAYLQAVTEWEVKTGKHLLE